MTTLKVEGYINQDGEPEFEMPSDHPVGKVTVTIESAAIGSDEEWTDEELDALLSPSSKPKKTGAEIIRRIHDFGPTEWDAITDSEAWVDEQRRRYREQYRW